MDIRGIVFDMDGLMFDTERLSVEGWKHAGRTLGVEVTTEMVTQTFGFDQKGTKQVWLQRLGQDEEKAERMYALRIAYQQDYIEHNGIPVKRGLRELLQYLKGKNYAITIASSSDEKKIRGYLEATGLSSYFGEIVGGNRIRRCKPYPDIYQLAAEVLRLPPGQCMALEDSIAGIRSAYAAGMVPVMIPDMAAPSEEIRQMAYAVLSSLEEVAGLLEGQTKKDSTKA